ncbi:MAG TPA: hypothetical protein VG265_16490 [Gaiellaceae bacterium]|nr:hypothetical protein [Gaiellaceae bacterium]
MDDDVTTAIERIEKRLDWIEESLRGWRGSGTWRWVAPTIVPTSPPVAQDVVDLVRAGKTREAIARYRESTGVDFGHAQAVVAGL